MKRIHILFLTLIISVFLCACGNGSAERSAEETESPSPVVETVEDAELEVVIKNWKEDGSTEEITRSGKFSGTLIDGVAEGIGKFTTKNSEGTTWTYEGEFKKGAFNGQGIQTWEDSDYTENGTFTDGLYTPTKAEFFSYSQQLYQDSICMPELAENFIVEHDNLFPCETEETINEASELTDATIERKHLSKGGMSIGDKFFSANGLTVQQIFESNECGYTFSWILASDSNYEYYAIYYLGSIDVYEGDRISIRALPLGNSSFENISGGTTLVVVCAGATVSKN